MPLKLFIHKQFGNLKMHFTREEAQNHSNFTILKELRWKVDALEKKLNMLNQNNEEFL